MNRKCGFLAGFSHFRDDGRRYIVGYGLEPMEDNLFLWNEIYFYKKKVNSLSFKDIENAIISDINAQTDEKILNGYQWTVLHGDDAGKTVNVWLSNENQSNFKAKHDTAVQYPNLTEWPIVYKVGEIEDEETGLKRPVYEHFQDVNELAQFYLGGLTYIERTLAEGWQRKDNIDWEPYKAYFQDNDDNT